MSPQTSPIVTTVEVQPKWILKSLTFWGAALSAAAVAYQVGKPIADSVGFTVPVTPEDIQNVQHVGAAAITAIGGVVGLGLTIWGRFKAGKTPQPVTILPSAPDTTHTVEIVKPPATPKSTG